MIMQEAVLPKNIFGFLNKQKLMKLRLKTIRRNVRLRALLKQKEVMR
jgi:hypothetical protein